MMEAAGNPVQRRNTAATCFGAAIATVAMGLFANRPIALASGWASTPSSPIRCASASAWTGAWPWPSCSWKASSSCCWCFAACVKPSPDAIVSLRRAIGIGIGLFIAFIGLKGGGFIAADESTFLALGDLTSPTAIVAAISIIVAVVLTAVNLKGATLLISIVAAAIIGAFRWA